MRALGRVRKREVSEMEGSGQLDSVEATYIGRGTSISRERPETQERWCTVSVNDDSGRTVGYRMERTHDNDLEHG